jgi:hypothetical protein
VYGGGAEVFGSNAGTGAGCMIDMVTVNLTLLSLGTFCNPCSFNELFRAIVLIIGPSDVSRLTRRGETPVAIVVWLKGVA